MFLRGDIRRVGAQIQALTRIGCGASEGTKNDAIKRASVDLKAGQILRPGLFRPRELALHSEKFARKASDWIALAW